MCSMTSEQSNRAQEIELTHARLKTLAHLRLPRFDKSLKVRCHSRRLFAFHRYGAQRLCLRQNLLSSLTVSPEAEGPDTVDEAVLEALTALEDLDLYDNRLPTIDGLSGLSSLRCALCLRSLIFALTRSPHSTLDLSFNLLRRIPAEALATMTSLKTLYIIQNKISHIEGLAPLAATLTSLELGGNKLRVRAAAWPLVNMLNE